MADVTWSGRVVRPGPARPARPRPGGTGVIRHGLLPDLPAPSPRRSSGAPADRSAAGCRTPPARAQELGEVRPDQRTTRSRAGDLKDSSIIGADIGATCRLTGADLADGAVGRGHLARARSDEVDVVYISSTDGTVTLFDEAGIGTIAFGAHVLAGLRGQLLRDGRTVAGPGRLVRLGAVPRAGRGRGRRAARRCRDGLRLDDTAHADEGAGFGDAVRLRRRPCSRRLHQGRLRRHRQLHCAARAGGLHRRRAGWSVPLHRASLAGAHGLPASGVATAIGLTTGPFVRRSPPFGLRSDTCQIQARTSDLGEELVRLASADNFRDVAGVDEAYVAADGVPLRRGVAFRSNELQLSDADAHSVADARGGRGLRPPPRPRGRGAPRRSPSPAPTWHHLEVKGIPMDAVSNLEDPRGGDRGHARGLPQLRRQGRRARGVLRAADPDRRRRRRAPLPLHRRQGPDRLGLGACCCTSPVSTTTTILAPTTC